MEVMTDTALPTTTGGLDRETKQKIKSWVLKLRHLFQDDLRTRLVRLGIQEGRSIREAPDYLDAEEKRARAVIVAAIRRETHNERSGDDALTAYIRECAYTLLNRLVGLKCMEARGILTLDGEPNEVVTTRSEYGDRSRLLWQMRDLDRSYRADETRLWRDGLNRVFRAVTEDIALLFDPNSEWSQVWPTHARLIEAVKLINSLDDLPLNPFPKREGTSPASPLPASGRGAGEVRSVYASPDFLGWVYQFFNAEEKEEIRAATGGKPRTSHELAVINQFYTPDWIVKFLVDNTLGRAWLRMHPDSRLRDRISYLVPNTGEDEPAPLKRVRDVKLLDPACGTMHMGQYAYGLFYEMYLEEHASVGKAGWPSESSVSAVVEIPAAILANNLHGIDIDPRAIQIAALTLLLTMKEQARAHGLDPQSVRVERMNLVCADAVNLGDTQMNEFINELDPRVFGGTEPLRRAVKAVWEGLKHVAELGSLVQVGEEVERALQTPITNRLRIYEPTQTSMAEVLEVYTPQLPLSQEQRATAREQLEYALADYARRHLSAEDINQRLFAQETGKAIHLLDLLRQQYDVVVMNPPYGDPTLSTKDTVKKGFPDSYSDMFTAFMDRGAQLLTAKGALGTLTSRSYLWLSSHAKFRRQMLVAYPPNVVLDLGQGVLDDAAVEVAAGVFWRFGRHDTCLFSDCSRRLDKTSGVAIEFIQQSANSVELSDFCAMPNSIFAYRLSPGWFKVFRELPPIAPQYAIPRVGLQTDEDARFLKLWWEITDEFQKRDSRWAAIDKGGEYCRYYSDVEHIIDWSDDGYILKENTRQKYGSHSKRVFNEASYFQDGLSYINISSVAFSAQFMEYPLIITVQGQGMFSGISKRTLAAIVNSDAFNFILNTINPGRHYQAGQIGIAPFPPEYGHLGLSVENKVTSIYSYKRDWDRRNEICTRFEKPWLLQAMDRYPNWKTLGELLDECRDWEEADSTECRRLQDDIDAAVYNLYKISNDDRALVARELGERPAETVWPQMAGKSREQKRVEHVCRLLSYLVKIGIEADEDGIVPLVPCGDEATLVERVRSGMETIFGAERSHAVEGEINNLLGKRVTLESWLAKQYFKYHVGLYKHRPIFWHITSEDGSFGAIVHYHRFTYDRLLKLRSTHLYDFIQRLQTEIGRLRGDDSGEAREKVAGWEDNLQSARALDEQLRRILEGDIPIEVPWKSQADQPKGWRPDIDDGVKVNIGPFEKAGVLSVKKVI